MNLTKTVDIKKRWQEYTEELYKRYLQDSDNHNDVITHLEPDILECEVKWALGSITTKLVELMYSSWSISNSKIWCCESAAFSIPANLDNSAMTTGLEKISFHPNPKETVAISFSRRSSQPRDWTQVSHMVGTVGRRFTVWATREDPIPKKGNAKECSNYHTIVLIWNTSKGMIKILQARHQQYVNCERLDVQVGYRNVRGSRDQIANIRCCCCCC